MRLIDADALKENISGNSYILSDSINSMNFGMFLDGIEQAIDESPTIDVMPRWISCNERLPEKEQLVLCQCRAGIIDVLRLKENGLWENLNLSPYVDYMPSFVIAWMPLPELYDGERKDDE